MRKPLFAFEKYATRLSILGLLLLVGGGTGLSAAVFSSAPLEGNADGGSVTTSDWTPSEEETEIGRTELAVTITSSALTDTSQSIGCVFRSQKVDVANNGARYSNVFVTSNDPNFSTFAEEIDQCKAEKTAKEAAGETYVLPDYEGSVYNIQYSRSARNASTIVIPEWITYQGLFRLHVTSIGNSVVFNQTSGDVNYGAITKVVIPKSIVTMGDDAFTEVPETVQFCVEAPQTYEDEAGETVFTYDNEWIAPSIPVTYGYQLDDTEKAMLEVSSSNFRSLGKGSDFFLGIDDPDYDYPMYMEYRLETQDEEGGWYLLPEVYYQKLPISSTNNNYDAVGTQMGVNFISPFFEVDIPENCRVCPDFVIFHNIFSAVAELDGEGKPTGKKIPDLVTGPLYSTPTVANFVMPNFSDLFTFEAKNSSSLGGFLHFNVAMHRQEKDGYGIYPEMNPNLFMQHKGDIDAKTLQIRYQFSTLDRAQYRFTFKENGAERVVTTRVSTPIPYVLASEKDMNFGFLINEGDIEGFNFDNLTKIELCGFTVKMDLYKGSTNSIVTKSAVGVRFAALSLTSDIHSIGHSNVGLIFAIVYSIFVVAYLAIAVAYYFYAKRRFRNDEFRRVNKKSYIISAAKNFVGTALVVSAILFIVGRWGLMNSSIVVFNPLDPFVVGFSVVALIYIGFTIKNLVISIKNAKKRRQAARLHLDDDVDDDGTH